MMETAELYNLYLGERLADVAWTEHNIGPFTVSLSADYDRLIAGIPKRPAFQGGFGPGLTRIPGREGGWQPTATVRWEPSGQQSVLLDVPAQDEGLWDLCAILTFLTGRNVVLPNDRENYRPDIYGDHAVQKAEVLRAAALAWDNRGSLVSEDTHFSLLVYNQAINTRVLQMTMSMYSTALNIIIDKQPVDIALPEKHLRNTLKCRISDLLAGVDGLNDDQRDRLVPLLSSAVDRGPSLADRMIAQIKECGLLSEPPKEDELARVKSVDKVRNLVVHAGRIPTLPGLDRETSLRIATNIAGGVLPELLRLLIGERLGFRPGSVGSLSQRREDLMAFFKRGVFRGWKLTEQTWEAFIEQLDKKGWPTEEA